MKPENSQATWRPAEAAPPGSARGQPAAATGSRLRPPAPGGSHRTGAWRLALAAVLPLIAFGIEWLLWAEISPYAWILLYPAVFASAWVGGLRGGVIATFVSVVLALWFFVPPVYSFDKTLSQSVTAALFVAMGLAFSIAFDRLERADRRTQAALAELRSANQSLAAATERATKLYQRTRELERLRTAFFTNVNHELRTPIALIAGPVETLLASGELSPDQRRQLESVQRSTRLLHDHVNDLLDAAKLEAGRVELTYVRTDVSELVRRTCEQFAPSAAERSIRLDVQAPGPVTAQLDPQEIAQALVNLVVNAIKFTPVQGTIRVELRREATGPGFSVVVADSGPGIPAADRQLIFERFHQAESGPDRRFGGTGLGLAIARDIVELHGGKITVGQAPEGGAEFTISLPGRAPEQTEVRAAPGAPFVPAQRVIPDSGQLPAAEESGPPDAARVLVIEDDPDMNRFVSELLAASYRVQSALNGEEGLVKAGTFRPDAIVCDVMMPRMSGDAVIAALRSDPRFEDVAVLMLSVKTDDHQRAQLLRAGADDYVVKPFLVEELRARIANLVARKRTLDAMREGEERFETLLDSAPDTMVVVDPDGQIAYCNRQVTGLLGYDPSELIGQSVELLVPEAIRAGHLTHRANYAQDPVRHPMPGQPERVLTARRKDGSQVTVDITLSPLRTNEGMVVCASLRDFTAQRRAETELRDSEARAWALANFTDALAAAAADPQAVLDAVASQLAESPGDCCLVLLPASDGRTLEPAARAHRNPDLLAEILLLDDHPFQANAGPAGAAFASGEASALNGLGESVLPGQPAAHAAGLRSHPVTGAVYLPLRAKHDNVGALVLLRHAPAGEYTAEEIALASEFGTRAALAYENTRLSREVAEGRRRFASAFDDAPTGIAMCGLGNGGEEPGRFLEVNRAFAELVGYSSDRLLRMRIGDLTHPEDSGADPDWLARLGPNLRLLKFEKRYVHADGHAVWVRVNVSAVLDDHGQPLYTINHIEDITPQIDARERLTHQALHDPVTGLPNRLLLMDRLEHAISQLSRSHATLAVLYVDCDRFKEINDSLGHAAGDAALVEVGHRLTDVVREPDTVARIGGDEFVIVCNGLDGEASATAVARRLLAALAEPMRLGSHEVFLSASIGIALAAASSASADDLLSSADAAMLHAKKRGRSRAQVFTPSLAHNALQRLELENELRHAIEDGRLALTYEPIVSLAHRQIQGLEARVSVERRGRGLLEPPQYLPIAEESGLIVPLGRWTFEQVCRDLARWRELGADVSVAVDLSGRELADPRLPEILTQTIAALGSEAARICIDVAETDYMQAVSTTLADLRRVAETGVRLVIDDFGTGYSSMSSLHRFPAEALKIDATLIAGLGTSTEDTAVVTGIVQLAHTLRLGVIANGVATQAQHEQLSLIGCDCGQGPYYSAPLTSEQIVARFGQDVAFGRSAGSGCLFGASTASPDPSQPGPG